MKDMYFVHVLQSARNEKKKVREKRSLHVSKLQEKSLKASLQAVVCICIKHTRAAKIQVRERAQNCTAVYNIAAELPLTLGF